MFITPEVHQLPNRGNRLHPNSVAAAVAQRLQKGLLELRHEGFLGFAALVEEEPQGLQDGRFYRTLPFVPDHTNQRARHFDQERLELLRRRPIDQIANARRRHFALGRGP